MRKITSFGLSAVALGALGWIATAQAQPAPEGTTAPPATAPAAAAPAAPEAAPAPAPAAPADAAPAAAAPAPDATTPAADAPAKPVHHHHAKMAKTTKMTKGVHRGADSDAAVEDLNAKSLSAAKSGTSFAPATATTPDKAPAKPAKTMKAKHHHHMMKKAAAAADAPAPDATPAPADTSK